MSSVFVALNLRCLCTIQMEMERKSLNIHPKTSQWRPKQERQACVLRVTDVRPTDQITKASSACEKEAVEAGDPRTAVRVFQGEPLRRSLMLRMFIGKCTWHLPAEAVRGRERAQQRRNLSCQAARTVSCPGNGQSNPALVLCCDQSVTGYVAWEGWDLTGEPPQWPRPCWAELKAAPCLVCTPSSHGSKALHVEGPGSPSPRPPYRSAEM